MNRSGCIIALLLLGVLWAPLEAQAPSGVVRGQIRSEDGGEPLIAAVIEVLGAGRPHAVITDSRGMYVLREVPAGRRVLRVSHLGHAPLELEVLVPAGREVAVDVALRLSPVELEPVAVQTESARGGMDTLSIPEAELGMADTRVLGSTPGLIEVGLADAARSIAGREPADPEDVLFVRGATADLKLVYLDGAPVYAPFPLGGVLESFTPGLLGAARVYLGGAPARYDGGLSYILDLRTRGVRTDAPHSSGAVDLLSSHASVEVPLGERAGVLAAGRAVHGLGAGQALPYGYREGLLRTDFGLGAQGTLSLTGFRNHEEVRLGSSVAVDSLVQWGNSAVSLRYRGPIMGEDAELTLALGDFTAELPLQLGRPVLTEGRALRTRFAGDFGRRFGDETYLRYGLSVDRLSLGYRGSRHDGPAAARAKWTRAVGDVVGLYTDLSWQASSRLHVRGGVRADHFSSEAGLVLAPRASATWALSDHAALKLAAGRYHQYLRAPESLVTSSFAPAGPGEASWSPTVPLAVGRACHLALSLDQDLGEGVRLGLEGFFKGYEGLPETGGTARASASGVDVWVRRSHGDWTGWLSYSLAWLWSQSGHAGGSHFVGRHLISSGFEAPLGDLAEIDVRFAYGAGIPYAAVPLKITEGQGPLLQPESSGPSLKRLSEGTEAPPLLPEPDRPFVRLDLGLSRSWSGRWRGLRLDLSSYVKLLNTLGRRDALFYHYDRGSDERPRALGTLPVVPVVGVEWRF